MMKIDDHNAVLEVRLLNLNPGLVIIKTDTNFNVREIDKSINNDVTSISNDITSRTIN